MYTFGFIGTGNMGTAMLKGAVRNFGQEQFTFYDPAVSAREKTAADLGIHPAQDNAALAADSKFILLAVKPQIMSTVLRSIKHSLQPDTVLISIAAGVSIDSIKEAVGQERRVVRAMPNTPAMVGEGMTGLAFDDSLYSEVERETIFRFFGSFGKYELIPEKLINAVICASGSSPAYVYVFIEALADSAVKAGMSRKTAYTMAAQTVMGAAKMVLETGEHPAALKDAVCSPAGTTIEGIAALEQYGFRNAVLQAGEAVFQKAENMQTKK